MQKENLTKLLCSALRLIRFDSFTYSLDNEINSNFKENETMHKNETNITTPVPPLRGKEESEASLASLILLNRLQVLF